MEKTAHFNIPIDKDLRERFKEKYPGSAGERLIELIKEDLGFCLGEDIIHSKIKEFDRQISDLEKERKVYEDMLSERIEKEEEKLRILMPQLKKDFGSKPNPIDADQYWLKKRGIIRSIRWVHDHWEDY